MASKQIVDNFVNTTADTIQVAYTAPSDKNLVVESVSASNTSSVNASYSAYIVSNGGTEQPQIPFKIVVWGEVDLGIGLVGQVIPASGELRIESSAINSIYFTVTGREVEA